MKNAFVWACGYGRTEVVDFLLDRGIEVDARFQFHGRGHIALHLAAYHAHAEIVRILLGRGAPVDVTDETWGTTPLVWALHAWSQDPTPPIERYYDVVAMLVAARRDRQTRLARMGQSPGRSQDARRPYSSCVLSYES